MYSSEFSKLTTQIFIQQPDNNEYNSTTFHTEPVLFKKPIAYVLPIERPLSRDMSVQTDLLPIDFGSIIDIRDFERSKRVFGRLESREIGNEFDSAEASLLQSRNRILQNALNEQKTRTDEVKKLLMVSLGDELATHCTQLMSDLTSSGDRVSSLLTEKMAINDSVDLMSIEADLWKNKFVAGRILVNELATWKKQVSLQYQESLDAIHNLLQERQSIRVLLSLISDQLIDMCSHLGLTQALKSYSTTMDLAQNSLDLARSVAHLLSTEAYRDKVVTRSSTSKQISEYTPAEESAIEVLLHRSDLRAGHTHKYVSSFSAKEQQGLERMALSICRNCRGEVFVV